MKSLVVDSLPKTFTSYKQRLDWLSIFERLDIDLKQNQIQDLVVKPLKKANVDTLELALLLEKEGTPVVNSLI